MVLIFGLVWFGLFGDASIGGVYLDKVEQQYSGLLQKMRFG